MRLYLLDTTPLAALLKGRPTAKQLITPWLQRQEVVTSSLVYAEVVEYLMGQPDYAQRRQDLRVMLRAVYPYAPTFGILERYAAIRRHLRPPHGPGLIGDIDTLIAATALEHQLTVVTVDGDFKRVPNLNVHLIPRNSL